MSDFDKINEQLNALGRKYPDNPNMAQAGLLAVFNEDDYKFGEPETVPRLNVGRAFEVFKADGNLEGAYDTVQVVPFTNVDTGVSGIFTREVDGDLKSVFVYNESTNMSRTVSIGKQSVIVHAPVKECE